MWPIPNHETELEAKLDRLPTKTNSDLTPRPLRKPYKNSVATAAEGRWVAPIILLLTVIISAILWFFS
ncbi:MAG TPA: hypothetical protein DEP87_02085 [Candidatus Pacebacteria bacterium]|nr:hypothetical protein [Candidatus Paceibacterota bacterium]